MGTVRAGRSRGSRPSTRATLALLVVLVVPRAARAVQLEALDITREWRVGALEFRGNAAVPASKLRDAMTTRERPWSEVWQVWKDRPPFEPAVFRDDLDRLRQLYRNEGFYEARIGHDIELPAQGDVLRIVVYIDEGAPVYVDSVSVVLEGAQLDPAGREKLLAALPVVRGRVFTQDAYERAFSMLRTYYREHGFARAKVTRRARVDARRGAVEVAYRVESGPPSVFGDVHVTGTHDVDPAIVLREVAFKRGQPFKQSLVEQTRSQIAALRTFRSVAVTEDRSDDPTVDVTVRVTEGPTHEVSLGVGYDTDEQIRGIASWRDYDFLGGARQLGFTARASFIRRTIAADFLQPHFPGPKDRIRVVAFEQQEEEDAFTNDRSRFSPRIEWQALPTLTPYAFYRIEYDSLSSVNGLVKKLFPDIAPSNGFLSGLGFGVDWNATDDLLDPSRGWIANASVEPVGTFLGGSFSFLRLVIEGRRFQPLPEDLLGAFRFRLGSEALLGDSRDVPLFERFYAGGINSVRGYARWRVGPLVDDDPIGGKSLVEASAELRHPITEKIGAAVFLDGGQVALDSWDFPFDSLRYGTGVGTYYKSPIGPLRVDLGFPVNRQPGDASWQVHVSLGQAF
jgi:outer membrane protein assembly complex protein YaeT